MNATIKRDLGVTVHPEADSYAWMNEDEFSVFKSGVEKLSTSEPVWLDQHGRLIDGRHRLRACRELGITPTFETFIGDEDDVLDFIAHRNLDRHQQRPEVRIAKRRERVACKRAEGKSLRQIAEEEAVSLGQVQRDLLQVYPDDTPADEDLDLQVEPEVPPVDDEPSSEPQDEPDTVIGSDGKVYPAKANRYTDEEAAPLLRRYDNATAAEREHIASELGIRVSSLYGLVATLRQRLGLGRTQGTAETRLKVSVIRGLAEQGHTSEQIGKKLGHGSEWIKILARDNDIVIVADAVMSGRRRIDHNRVIEQTVVHATVDQATLELVDYSQLDRSRLEEWVSSLEAAIRSLNTIKHNLKEELSQ